MRLARIAGVEAILSSIMRAAFSELDRSANHPISRRPLFRSVARWSLLLAASTAFAGNGVQVEAKETGSGSSRQVVVTFRDSSAKAGAISAHVYFIGQAPHGGARFIYAHSDVSVNLNGLPEASAKVEVPALKSDPTRRAPHGYALIGIGESEGWIVISQVSGTKLPTRASNAALARVAAGKSTDSLEEMIADYKTRSSAPARHP